MPRIDRIRWRSLISRGEPPVRSTHFVKSISLTWCSTRTSATETLTTLTPCAMPATQSFPRIAATPCATASYSVVAVSFHRVRDAIHILNRDAARAHGHGGKISYSLFIRHRTKMLAVERPRTVNSACSCSSCCSGCAWVERWAVHLFEEDAADDGVEPNRDWPCRESLRYASGRIPC